MDREEQGVQRDDGFVEDEKRFPGYTVYDGSGEKVGSVQRFYRSPGAGSGYLGVKRDIVGLNVEMVPLELATVDDDARRIELSTDKDRIKNSPTFYEAQEITPEYEATVRQHYGL